MRAGAGPVGYGPSGSSAPGKLRKRSASGRAAAKARRTRLTVCSTTRSTRFQDTKTQASGLGSRRFPDFGMSVARAQRPAVEQRCRERSGSGWRAPSGGWCDRRRAASCAAWSRILGLAARAVPAVVAPLSGAGVEAGDDRSGCRGRSIVASMSATVRRSQLRLALPCGASRYSRAGQTSSRWRVRCQMCVFDGLVELLQPAAWSQTRPEGCSP